MPRTVLNSTSLRTAGYHEQLAVLEIEFNDGSVYRYSGVPIPTDLALLGAESPGRFFNSHIRKHFGCTQIKPAD